MVLVAVFLLSGFLGWRFISDHRLWSFLGFVVFVICAVVLRSFKETTGKGSAAAAAAIKRSICCSARYYEGIICTHVAMAVLL